MTVDKAKLFSHADESPIRAEESTEMPTKSIQSIEKLLIRLAA